MTEEEQGQYKRLLLNRVAGHYDDEDCWPWAGSLVQGAPCLSWKSKKLYAKRVMWAIDRKKPVPANLCVVNSCDDPMCINPRHLKVATKQQVIQATAKTGKLNPPGFAAKIAAMKRAKSKLSDEAVAAIKTGTDHPKDAAAKHGCSVAYVYMLRRNLWRNDYRANPFSGLLAANSDQKRKTA